MNTLISSISSPTVTTKRVTPTHLLIDAGTFLATNMDGMIAAEINPDTGLFAEDTRFLSRYTWNINGRIPRYISHTCISPKEMQLEYLLAGEDIERAAVVNALVPDTLPSISVSTKRRVEDHQFTEDFLIDLPQDCEAVLAVRIESDFADLFEVRTRQWQGRHLLSTQWNHEDGLQTTYTNGSYKTTCSTCFENNFPKISYANGLLYIPLRGNGKPCHIILHVRVHRTISQSGTSPFVIQNIPFSPDQGSNDQGLTTIEVDNPDWQRVIDAAQSSLLSLRLYGLGASRFPENTWVYAAGAPWFVTVFGRDAIVTSLQTMLLSQQSAYGTMAVLSTFQSTIENKLLETEPGKLLHEVRVGEWTWERKTPHQPYYGTHDTQILFLMLLAKVYRWGGSSKCLKQFKPTADKCLAWMDTYGDLDHDGFQEYNPRAKGNYGEGLGHFSWKDNDDSIPTPEGTCPAYPVAMSELQGYAYAAKLEISDLYAAWGDEIRAQQLRDQAEILATQFYEHFWVPEQSMIPIALDGEKLPVASASSNSGHCLMTGIVDEKRGFKAAKRLLRKDMFSGWGLRTLSSLHKGYDPYSYHCGSVWPHDTIFAAMGCRKYGADDEALRLIQGIFDAAASWEDGILPELFGGNARTVHQMAPHIYPFMNRPQAWASGSVFQAIECLLGLEPDIPAGTINLNPILPTDVTRMRIRNWHIGKAKMDIEVWRNDIGNLEWKVTGERPYRVEKSSHSYSEPYCHRSK